MHPQGPNRGTKGHYHICKGHYHISIIPDTEPGPIQYFSHSCLAHTILWSFMSWRRLNLLKFGIRSRPFALPKFLYMDSLLPASIIGVRSTRDDFLSRRTIMHPMNRPYPLVRKKIGTYSPVLLVKGWFHVWLDWKDPPLEHPPKAFGGRDRF